MNVRYRRLLRFTAMIWPFGMKMVSPFRSRMTVVRSPTASTTPEYFEGSTSMKSPTPYWFSKRMKKPAMMSVRSLWAENAMIRMISVAPAPDEDGHENARGGDEKDVANNRREQGKRGLPAP